MCTINGMTFRAPLCMLVSPEYNLNISTIVMHGPQSSHLVWPRWVRIPPGLWMFIGCECCVLSRRGLCDELITRPEESYRLWCVVVCDQETSQARRVKPATGLWKVQTQWVVTPRKQTNNPTCYCNHTIMSLVFMYILMFFWPCIMNWL